MPDEDPFSIIERAKRGKISPASLHAALVRAAGDDVDELLDLVEGHPHAKEIWQVVADVDPTAIVDRLNAGHEAAGDKRFSPLRNLTFGQLYTLVVAAREEPGGEGYTLPRIMAL